MPSDCVDKAVSRKRKIEQPNLDTGKKRRKVRDNSVIFDRISDLPEPIIHLIFSSIKCTKDVARTTVLSKKWKNNFNSYLTFDFDERWFRQPKKGGKHNRIKARELQKKKFKSYVEGSLRTRLDPVPCIEKFKLYVSNIDKALLVCMESWVCAALSKNVKELDIQVDTKDKQFVLPGDVLMSSFITSLKLSGCIQSGFSKISMSNLRQLSIKESNLASDSVIKQFETSCPLLEDLRLVSCTRITCLFISSLLKLKRVEVQDCNAESIKIAGPRLETFLYQGDKNQVCKIDLKGSENLRNLTLRESRMKGSVFQDLFSNCPFIEKLELIKCPCIESVTILSERLKCLALIKCSGLKEVNIDAPNLYSLEFSGQNKIPFTSVNVLGLRKAKFSFSPKKPMSKCMAKYQQCFANFDRSKGFKLIVYSDQCMKIYEEPREACEEVASKLELTLSLTRVSEAVDNWLRESHGKSIVLMSPSSELIKSTQTLIMQRGEEPTCCSLFSNKCWRHFLEDVTVLNLSSMDQMQFDFKWKSRRKVKSKDSSFGV